MGPRRWSRGKRPVGPHCPAEATRGASMGPRRGAADMGKARSEKPGERLQWGRGDGGRGKEMSPDLASSGGQLRWGRGEEPRK